MSPYLSPDQVRDEYVRLMGPELGQCHCDLFNDIAWLHLKWEQYRELFGTNEERIALLNETGPLFFGLLQDVLFDDILLHLARLTDPPRSVGKDNLSVRRLVALVEEPSLRSQAEDGLAAVLARCEFARDWRNRRIVHADLATVRGQSPVPLAFASRQSVEDALGAMRDLLNVLEERYHGGPIAYDFIREYGGADLLVHYLTLGLKQAQAERCRPRGGMDPSAA